MSLSLLPSMRGTFWSIQHIALHDVLQNYQMQAAVNTNTKCRNAVSVKHFFFPILILFSRIPNRFPSFCFSFFGILYMEVIAKHLSHFSSQAEITVQRRSSFQIKYKEVWLRWQGGLETQAWIFKLHLSILV